MKIFPIVHIKKNDIDCSDAARESKIALSLGADGIYLIDHYSGGNTDRLFEAYNLALAESPDQYIGINILGMSPIGAMRALAKYLKQKNGDGLPLPLGGLWVDDMRGYGGKNFPKLEALELKRSDEDLKRIRLVGGVAFKYTKTYYDDPDMSRYEAEWLKDAVDIMVTSGPATGQSPSIEKCLAMKEVIGDKPLAVASGLSVDNIGQYEGIVNEAMVSTSIETYRGSGMFSVSKLDELIKIAHDLAD